MKNNLYVSLLLVFCFSALHAQSIDTTIQPDFYNRVEKVLNGPQGELLVFSVSRLTNDVDLLYLTRIDTTGKVVTNSISVDLYNRQFDVLPMQDRYIVLTGGFQCDINNDLLRAIGPDGNTLWENTLNQVGVKPQLTFRLLPGLDTTVWVVQPGQKPLLFSTRSGAFIGDTAAVQPLPDFTGFVQLSDDKLLTYSNNGLRTYRKSDLQPLEVRMPDRFFLDAEQLPDGHWALLATDSIFRIDSSLNVVSARAHADYLPAGTVIELASGDSAVWMHASGEQIQRFDYNLQPVALYPLDFSQTLLKRITEFKNHLTLISEETAFPALFSQVIDIRGFLTPLVKHNAGLTALNVSKASGTAQSGSPVSHKIRLDKITVTIRNSNTETLREVTLNAFLSEGFNLCPYQFALQRRIDGLSVPPQSEIQLVLDSLVFIQPSTLPASYNLCMWTTRPNGRLDADHADNQVCASVSITSPVSQPVGVQKLGLFPNPASQECMLVWPENGSTLSATVRVFEHQGRMVHQFQTYSGYTLKRLGLPAGRYTCIVTTQDGRTFLGKLIWE